MTLVKTQTPRLVLSLLLLFLCSSPLWSAALPLSQPPAGAFLSAPTRASLLSAADFLASSGLRDIGFDIIMLDNWAAAERKDGRLVGRELGVVDMGKAVADMGKLGFRVGVTANGGVVGCHGEAGSLDNEKTDASTFAAWGIAYVLYTSCNPAGVGFLQRYQAMAKALNETGKGILFGVKDDGVYEPTTWAPKLAHTWTTTPPLDTTPIFTNLETPTYSQRAVKNLGRLLRVLVNKLGLKAWIADNMEDWRSWAAGDERGAVTIWGRQGSLANFTGQERGYNDMGPLRFTGLSQEEQRSVVLMWSLLKSPLFVAGDFDTMPKDAVKLLRHPDLIKLNRDGGRQMDALMKRGKAEVWTRAIENGILVVLVNRDSLPATLGFDFKILPGINPNLTYSISTLFGPDLLPFHLGYYGQRYVTREDGVVARGVAVYELTVAGEDVDERSVIVPELPKSRQQRLKEKGEAMKKARQEEKEKTKKEGEGKVADAGKDEL